MFMECNELLLLCLNVEFLIFWGCLFFELMMLVIVGVGGLVFVSIIICGLFGYLMMGVGIGLLLVIGWVVIGVIVL